jgi:hypothetical protein
MGGVRHKVLARASGLSLSMVRKVCSGQARADIAPDLGTIQRFSEWLKRDNNSAPGLPDNHAQGTSPRKEAGT